MQCQIITREQICNFDSYKDDKVISLTTKINTLSNIIDFMKNNNYDLIAVNNCFLDNNQLMIAYLGNPQNPQVFIEDIGDITYYQLVLETKLNTLHSEIAQRIAVLDNKNALFLEFFEITNVESALLVDTYEIRTNLLHLMRHALQQYASVTEAYEYIHNTIIELFANLLTIPHKVHIKKSDSVLPLFIMITFNSDTDLIYAKMLLD